MAISFRGQQVDMVNKKILSLSELKLFIIDEVNEELTIV